MNIEAYCFIYLTCRWTWCHCNTVLKIGHFLCRLFEVCDTSLGVSLLQQSDDFLEIWIWPHTFLCGSTLGACFLINFLLAPSLSVRKESPVKLLRLSLQWVPWAVISEPSIPLKFCSQLEKCYSYLTICILLLVKEARKRKYEYFLKEVVSSYMHIKWLTAEDSKALQNID